MNTGNVVGALLGIKLINGKIRPKFGFGAIIALIFMIFFLIFSLICLIYGMVKINLEVLFVGVCGIFGFGYMLLISPYTQNSNNYYIEFTNENSLNGFRLFYKGNLVNILYKIDNKGKIAYAKNSSKLSCISYADGTKMSNITKYKIINYFGKWLNDNNLMSEEITTTFEQL